MRPAAWLVSLMRFLPKVFVARTTPYGFRPVLVSPSGAPQTGRVSDGAQATVAARIPGAASLGLVVPPSVPLVPATQLADPAWIAEVLGPRAGDLRVPATVWWYSASAVLVTPVLAGLVVGVPLSARLADTSLAFRPDGLPVAAVSSARGSRSGGGTPGGAGRGGGGRRRGRPDAGTAALGDRHGLDRQPAAHAGPRGG